MVSLCTVVSVCLRAVSYLLVDGGMLVGRRLILLPPVSRSAPPGEGSSVGWLASSYACDAQSAGGGTGVRTPLPSAYSSVFFSSPLCTLTFRGGCLLLSANESLACLLAPIMCVFSHQRPLWKSFAKSTTALASYSCRLTSTMAPRLHAHS